MQKTFCDDCGCDMSTMASCHNTSFGLVPSNKFYIFVRIMRRNYENKFADICFACAKKLIRKEVVFPEEKATRYEKIVRIRPVLEKLFAVSASGLVDTNKYGNEILDILENTRNVDWDDAGVGICEKHGVPMILICPRCSNSPAPNP